MANEAIRRRKNIVDADAETNLLYYLNVFFSQVGTSWLLKETYFIGILCVQIVFDALSTWFLEILRGNLDQVRDGGLQASGS